MRKPSDDDDKATLPFPAYPVSNGEWCPKPITDRQRTFATLVAEECAARAKRHGMSRAQFLRTAAATMTAFMVFNKVYGYDQTGDNAMLPVKREHCDDLDAAREVLDRKQWFIMDVQQHHVDLDLYGGNSFFCFLQFVPSELMCPESIGQLNYVKQVFVNSETTVGVISGLPGGLPLGPEAMAQTRDLVNGLAGSERALAQAVCDPKNAPGTPTSIDAMELQVRERGARALKSYTYNGNWRLDDADGTKMIAEAERLGLGLVNVHKGLPALFAPGSPETVRTIDFPGAVRNFPKMRFCAYHSGYFGSGDHPTGKDGISEFVEQIGTLTRKERKRVYGEIGSTYAITMLGDQGDAPGQEKFRTAHLIGQLVKALGTRNVLWGTDSVWWGSPQFLIDHFKTLQIPAELQENFGYKPLTDKVKRRIFGLNAAKLYKVKPKVERCSVPLDRLEQLQMTQGGPREGRDLRWFGPQTRRGFFALLRGEWRPRV